MFCSQVSWGQNLIPNASFEDTISYGGGFTSPKLWTTPEGFNTEGEHYTPYNQYLWKVPQSFAGYQNAQNGNSYFGMRMYFLYKDWKALRDYIQTRLNRTLIKDSSYCLRIYVNLPDSMTHASRGQLGIYLSNSAISSTSNFNFPYTPQMIVSPTNYISDKLNWTEFNLQYTAQGGERYMTIGNFNDTLGIDTLLAPGGGLDVAYFGTYYFIDNLYFGNCDSAGISVGLNEVQKNENPFSIYPNPAKEKITIAFNAQMNGEFSLELYNTLGQLKISQQLNQLQVQDILLNELQQGIYFYRLIKNSEVTYSGKLIVE